MVGLEKYHETTKIFLETLRSNKEDLCVSNRELWFYEAGAWRLVSGFLQDRLDRTLKKVSDAETFPFAEKYNQLWRNIKAELPVVPIDDFDKAGLIAMPNGETLNPVTGERKAHDPEDYITRRIAVTYDPKAKCPRWLKMLERIFQDKSEKDKREYIDFLQCWFGLALVGFRGRFDGRQYRKMLFLWGVRGTGKTTIAEVLKILLGEENIATDDVDQLSSQFGLERISEAIAIVSDDAASQGSKINTGVFKKLITGESLSATRKFKTTLQFRFHGPICITANEQPTVNDSTDALYHRVVSLEPSYQFTPEDQKETLEGFPNPWSLLKARKEMPGILNWALKGLAIVEEMQGLPPVAESNAINNTWRGDNDPCFTFLHEHCQFKKGVTNYSLPLGAAISVYAEMQMGNRSWPTSKAAKNVGRSIQDGVVPGARRVRRQLWKEQVRCYENLEIKESGLRYVAMAREKGLLPTAFPVNERELGDEPTPTVSPQSKSKPKSKKAAKANGTGSHLSA